MAKRQKNNKKTQDEGEVSGFLTAMVLGVTLFFGVVIYFSSEYSFWEKLALQTRQFKSNDVFSLLDTDSAELLEQSFWQIELQGEQAVYQLVKIVKDESKGERERLNAIYALGRLGKNGAKSVNILVSFLRHENENIRGVTVRALGKIGDAAAVFSIEPLLEDEKRWVKEGAQWALSVIKSKSAREILVRHNLDANNILKDGDAMPWIAK